MKKFSQHYRNAKACIAQMKRGEWIPEWNLFDRSYIRAERNGMNLWVGNGPWFVDIDDKNYFGLLFRHWVWYAGAWKLRYAKKPKIEVPVLDDSAIIAPARAGSGV